MSYTVNQLKALDARELLTIAEHGVCEFSTTATEQALIYHLNEVFDLNDDMLCPHEVEDVLNEVSAQLPEDDFLGHAIDIANEIAKGKMRKDELKAEGGRPKIIEPATSHPRRTARRYRVRLS